jgi:hypothetical protein
MAQSRIFAYDGENVSFWYQDHATGKRKNVTLPAFDFIKRLIAHIHDKGFNALRYYGIYAKKHKFSTQLVLLLPEHVVSTRRLCRRRAIRIELSFGHDPTKCKCGQYMEFLGVFLPGDLAFMPP